MDCCFLAIIVEGIITYIKNFFVGGKFQWQLVVAVALGVLTSVAYNIDLFSLLGMVTVIPYLGCVLTGVLISRGSNYIFDLIGQLTNNKSTPPDSVTTN